MFFALEAEPCFWKRSLVFRTGSGALDGARQVEGDQLLGVRRGETNCLARAPFSALADAEALLRRARIPTPPNAAGRRDEATWPRRLIGREQTLGAKNTPALDGAPCRLVLH